MIDFNDFLAKFQKVKRVGTQYNCLCPAHGDKKRSLTISQNGEGKILAKCFAGCNINDILAAVGLETKDLFPNKKESAEKLTLTAFAHAKNLNVDFLLAYCAETDSGLSVRYLDVDQSACRTRKRWGLSGTENSCWEKSEGKNKPIVAYGAWKIPSFSENYLIIVEGETDCWSLWQHGFQAIGLPGATMTGKVKKEYLGDIKKVYISYEKDAAAKGFVEKLRKKILTFGLGIEIFCVDWGAHKDPNDGLQREKEFKKYVTEKLRKAEKINEKLPWVEKALPETEVIPGNLDKEVDFAETVLAQIAKKENIFQRFDSLYQIVFLNGFPRFIPLTENRIVDILTKHATWRKGRNKINCPKMVAACLIDRRNYTVPVLRSIIYAPTMRPDGSVLDVPGYDAKTEIYYCPTINFPKIPQNPTQFDALQSLQNLAHLLDGFPFVGKSDKAVALSAIFSAVGRHYVRTVPLHGFTAPTPRTGKTLLADIANQIAAGEDSEKISLPFESAEFEKRLFSILLEAPISGGVVANIDNIERPLSGESLCTILTENKFKCRLLGHNKTVAAPTGDILWVATGNNLTVKGDMATRTILCTLNADVESPEERTFAVDLREGNYIARHRGALVKDALTVLRAYHLNTEKTKLSRYGGFQDWSDKVRAALVWLDYGDPCDSRKTIKNNDPEKDALGSLLIAWRSVFVDRKIYLADLKGLPQNTENHKLLLEILFSLSSKNGKELDTRRLAKFLSKFKNRIVNGLKFVCAEKKGKKGKWWMAEKIKENI